MVGWRAKRMSQPGVGALSLQRVGSSSLWSVVVVSAEWCPWEKMGAKKCAGGAGTTAGCDQRLAASVPNLRYLTASLPADEIPLRKRHFGLHFCWERM